MKYVTLRLPQEAWDRAAALAPLLQATPELGAWSRVTPSAVLRFSLLKGLAQLEADLRASEDATSE